MVLIKLSKLTVLLFLAISRSTGAFVPRPRQLSNVEITPTATGVPSRQSSNVTVNSTETGIPHPSQLNNVTVTSSAIGIAVTSVFSSTGIEFSSTLSAISSGTNVNSSKALTPAVLSDSSNSADFSITPTATERSVTSSFSSVGIEPSSTISAISNDSVNFSITPTSGLTPTALDGSQSTGTSRITSLKSSENDDTLSGLPSPSGSEPSVVPIIIKATDGSDRSITVKWSVVEHGSTSTTDQSGHPTIIPAPFWTCGDPLCVGTGCVLAILCSGGGVGGGSGAGGITPGFKGFPPPLPPSGPPPGSNGDSPSLSANPSPSITGPSLTSTASTTSSVSTTTTSSGKCSPITTVTDAGPTSAGDPEDDSRRRLRIRRHSLVARDAPKIKDIGGCPLTDEVQIPLYLSYKGAMNLKKQPGNGANARIYDAIEKWYHEKLATDGTPFSGEKLDQPLSGVGSVDHVWEKSNLADFLSSLLGSQGSEFDCYDLNALFSSCGIGLQKVFDQLPSMDGNNVQTGFAFMNRNLNGMKGWMFSQGYTQTRFKNIYNTDEKVIQGLQRQAIIFNLFNTDKGIQSMHDQTNNRVYSIFLALDNYISTNKVQRANNRGDLTQKFAPAFKTWYTQLLTRTGTESYAWASGEVTRLDGDPTLPACLRKAIDSFRLSSLYGSNMFQIDQSHLTWTVIPVVLKRDLVERDRTCKLSKNSASTTSTPSTVSPAATPSAIAVSAASASAASVSVAVASVLSASSASAAAASASQAAADATWSAAAAIPTASCRMSDDWLGISTSFEISGINGWAGDDGSKLFNEEDGCGLIRRWQWKTGIQTDFQGRPRDTQVAYFTISFFKGGCIERAVHSAGGPPPGRGDGQLSCQSID